MHFASNLNSCIEIPCRLHLQGGGIAYGTKEGRLRILTHSSYPLTALAGSNVNSWTRLEDELLAAAAEQAESSEEE